MKSNSHIAATPVIAAVPNVPRTASEIAGRSTGRIFAKPLARPASNRITAAVATPTKRASS